MAGGWRSQPENPQSCRATWLSIQSLAQAGTPLTSFKLHISPLTRPFSTQLWKAGMSAAAARDVSGHKNEAQDTEAS